MADGEQGRVVPIEFVFPEGVRTVYSTNLVVQHTAHEFIVSFFEVQPPLVVGTSEMKERTAAALESVKANCVSRVVIAASRMREFVQVMQDNLSTYEATRPGPAKEPENSNE